MKYKSVSELKVGQRVKMSELDKIVGIPIYLKKDILNYSSGDPEGEIAFIGVNTDPHKSRYLKIMNQYDATEGCFDGGENF